jgi:hypothetical protein
MRIAGSAGELSYVMPIAPPGTLTLTLLVDVGERIDLAIAEARVRSAGRAGRRPVLRRNEAKGSIRIPVPPLILDFSEELPSLSGAAAPSGWSEALHVAVYDFGVVSCRRILTWRPEQRWAELVPVIADLIHGADTRGWSDPLVSSVESLLGPAIQEPDRSAVNEEYAILRLSCEPEGGFGESDIARLLLCEQRALAPAARESLLGRDFRYTQLDRTIVAYDAALVVEPDPTDHDVELLIEFANAQLLELEVYDAILESRVPQLDARATAMGVGPGALFARRSQRLVTEVHQLTAKTSRLIEQATNALRITDDIYLARIYRAVLDVMNEPAWRLSVERKLMLARTMAEALNDIAVAARSQALEIIIVLLILGELVLSLMRRG